MCYGIDGTAAWERLFRSGRIVRLDAEVWHGRTAAAGTARFFLLFLAAVSLVEFVIMEAIHAFVPPATPPVWVAVADGMLLAAVLAPLAWIGFVRPLQRLNDERGLLLDQLMAAQEDERRRIAADLHDGLGQQLTTMLLRLQVIEEAAVPEPVRENAAALREIASAALAETRRVARDARPPVLDTLGLAAALEKLLDDLDAATGIAISFTADGCDTRRLPPAVETAVYRVVQEAATNAVKHARPDRIEVAVACGQDRIAATVRDQGCGFDVREALRPTRRSCGLLGMRERVAAAGGTLDVTSRPGGGTTVAARVPVAGLEPPA